MDVWMTSPLRERPRPGISLLLVHKLAWTRTTVAGTLRAMSKKAVTETEICDPFITPAIHGAGWDTRVQVRRESTFTAGQVLVRGKLVTRVKKKRADHLLFHHEFPSPGRRVVPVRAPIEDIAALAVQHYRA